VNTTWRTSYLVTRHRLNWTRRAYHFFLVFAEGRVSNFFFQLYGRGNGSFLEFAQLEGRDADQ
jgi:hypothetical protein